MFGRQRSWTLLLPLLPLAMAAIKCSSGHSGGPEGTSLAQKEAPLIDDDSVLSRPASPPDAQIAYGSGSDEIADLRFGGERAAQRPLVVLVHGGFWRPAYDRTHTGPMAQALAAAGWTVVSPEYRRIPGNPDATLRDVRSALEVLPAKVDGRRHNGHVVVIGHSAGGHLALWAAAAGLKAPLQGVLALAPVADLRLAEELRLGGGAVGAFLGVRAESRAELDPRRMSSPSVSTTIVQGEEDAVVPPAIAESFVAAHPKVRLVRIQAAGHYALIDPLSAAWPVVLEELGRL